MAAWAISFCPTRPVLSERQNNHSLNRMSIANLIIGKKPAPAATQEAETVEQRPLTPEELIDAVAESEFPMGEGVEHDTTGVGSPGDGSQPGSAMKTGKGVSAGPASKAPVSAKSKKTKGQVADTPKSGDPVGYGKS